MSKFKVGDNVVITSRRNNGAKGIITKIANDDPYGYDNSYYVDIYEGARGEFVCEHDLRLAERSERDIFVESLYNYQNNSYNDDYDYLTEMAVIKGGFMSIKLAIYGSEGKYPHFHFYKGIAPEKGVPQNKISGGGCICIETANYFIHGRHTEKMDRKEIKALIDFLKSPHKQLTKYTNWEYLVTLWNDNNPEQKQLPIDLPIPDYRHDMDSVQED